MATISAALVAARYDPAMRFTLSQRTRRSRRSRQLVRLFLTLAVVALLAPASAVAASGPWGGQKWPTAKIRVFNAAKADAASFNLAVAVWNSSGSRVRFVKVTSRSRADVVVQYSRSLQACGLGLGTLGYPGRGRKAGVWIRRGTPADGQTCAFPGQAIVITHELGHVLGFQHETRRCSIMNTVHSEGRAPKLCLAIPTGQADAYVGRDNFGRWRCGLIEAIDVKRLVRRYGGAARPRPTNPWCDLYQPIEPPTPLTVTRADIDNGDATTTIAVRVELGRPTNPLVPSFISADPNLSAQGLRDKYLLYRTAGACLTARPLNPYSPPAGTALVNSGAWTVSAASTEVVTDIGYRIAGDPVPLDGELCWSAWSWDPYARPSRNFAHAALVI